MLQVPDLLPLKLPEIAGRSLIHRHNIGTAMHIAQSVGLTCHQLPTTDPGLALVLSGRKVIHENGKEISASEGSVMVFGPASEVDITNILGRNGTYRALAIFFDASLLPPVCTAGTKIIDSCCLLPDVDQTFHDAMVSAAEAMGNVNLPDAIVSHRLRELLLWVEARGFCMVKPQAQHLVARLRALFMTDPSADWPAQKIAESLAMSEAMLRRKLAKVGTTLTDIIIDVRMTMALFMLQSTDRSITEISFAVGYESPSRFAMRFRNRFGFAPSELRHA